MRSKQRPIRYHDFHLPLARELFLKETGLWSDNPPRAIRKRAALMQGRASDPTAWPKPYRLRPGDKPRYETVSDGHIVAVA